MEEHLADDDLVVSLCIEKQCKEFSDIFHRYSVSTLTERPAYEKSRFIGVFAGFRGIINSG